ncbi:MAG TPA: sensor histidine kinase [Gemmatimonadaceae bacterium]|nr:sensor histidine kinase [Gemmatimonadaceae bacterium]
MSGPAEARITQAQLDWRVSSLVAAGACAAIGILECAKDYVMAQIQGTERPLVLVLRDEALWWVLWMLVMPGVVALGQRFRFDNGRWRSSSIIHLVLAVVLSLMHIAVFGVAYFWAVGPTSWGPTRGSMISLFTARYLAMDVIIYAGAIGVYYAFEFFARFRRTALEAAQIESRASRLQLNLAEARIHALRMELNPHFLFNALNAVAGLVRKRQHDEAVDMLARLGDLLRTTLDREMPAEVALSEELAYLGRFVDIELVRFGDRLRVTWEIDPEVRNALVPPLILQPLVENALRHGVGRRPGPASLRVAAKRSGLHLELTVRDSGEGLHPVDGRVPREGIGLSNTRARLTELYGPDVASVDVADVPGGGVRARLLLPYHTSVLERDVAVGA